LLTILFGFAASTAQADSPLKLMVENQTFVYNLEHTSIDTITNGFTLIGNQAMAGSLTSWLKTSYFAASARQACAT